MTSDHEDSADHSAEPANPERAAALNAAERVIEQFGGIRPMASKLEVPVTTVQGWKKRGVIPSARHADIRAAASRHGVQLDPAELAAADPGEDDAPVAGSALATTAPDTPAPHGADAHRGRADGVGVAVIASVIAVIAAIAAATAPLWTPRLFPPRAGSGELAQQVQAVDGRVGAIEKRIPEDPSGRIKALEDAIGSVKASLEALPRDAGSAVAERLGRLEQRVESLPSQATPDPALGNRLAAIEKRVEEIAGQAGQLQSALGETAAAAKSAQALEPTVRSLQDTVQALQGTIRDLQGAAEETRRTLARVENGQAELAADLKRARQQDLRTEASVLALSHLRMALQDAEPFSSELAAVRGLSSSEPTAPLAKALERVAPHAATGAPTRAQLRERFEPLAGAIVRAGRSTEDASWADETLNRISSLVTIRRAPGETEGNSVGAIVARAESRLNADDLSGAIHALGALSGKAAEIAAPWLQQARARLALDEAAAEVARAAVARVGAAAQPTPGQPTPGQPAAGQPTQAQPGAARPAQ